MLVVLPPPLIDPLLKAKSQLQSQIKGLREVLTIQKELSALTLEASSLRAELRMVFPHPPKMKTSQASRKSHKAPRVLTFPVIT